MSELNDGVYMTTRITIAQQEATFFRDKVATNEQLITDYKYELELLQKRIEQLENDRTKDKSKIDSLQEMLNQAREVSPTRMSKSIIFVIADDYDCT